MMNNVFEPLPLEDIDEKIELNKKQWGYDLIRFKQLLEFELAIVERGILREKWEWCKEKEQRPVQDLIYSLIPNEIQVSNLKEQIRHVQNRILREGIECQQSTQLQ